MTGSPDHPAITKPDGTRWRPPWSGLLDLDDTDEPLHLDLTLAT
jgi:hypothetical protein